MTKLKMRRNSRHNAEVIALSRSRGSPANDNDPRRAPTNEPMSPLPEPASSYPYLDPFWPASVFLASWAAWWTGGGR
ncbi:MAG: hypothetical protein ABWY00_11110 [Dongiaceae bacterium]